MLYYTLFHANPSCVILPDFLLVHNTDQGSFFFFYETCQLNFLYCFPFLIYTLLQVVKTKNIGGFFGGWWWSSSKFQKNTFLWFEPKNLVFFFFFFFFLLQSSLVKFVLFNWIKEIILINVFKCMIYTSGRCIYCTFNSLL